MFLTIHTVEELYNINELSCRMIGTVILVDKNLKNIPDIIYEFKNLRHLILRKNFIKYIPKKLFDLDKLCSLDLSNNNITYVPKSIKKLKSLQSLDLYSNCIRYFSKEIVMGKSLIFFDIRHNNIKKIDYGLIFDKEMYISIDATTYENVNNFNLVTKVFIASMISYDKNKYANIPMSVKIVYNKYFLVKKIPYGTTIIN